MYKLIAIDLDGTLLNSKGKISQRSKRILKDYEAGGGIVTLVSGRGETNMREIVNDIGLSSSFHVGLLGNKIFSHEKSYPSSFTFSDLQYRSIVSCLDENELPFLVCSGNSLYYKRYKACYLYEWITHGVSNEVFYRADIENLPGACRFGIYTVERDIYERAYETLSKIPGIVIYRDFPNMEIIPQEATKAHGLRTVADYLGIKMEEIIAFGDAPIDEEMILEAGLGIVVGNGAEKLKSIADVVLQRTNDEDAVACAIEKYMTQKELA